MDPPSRPTAAILANGSDNGTTTALNHSSRPHAPHLLNRSQSEDSGHLSLSTEHGRFTRHQVIVNRLNQANREDGNRDASRQHEEPAKDDVSLSVSAADALALIQFSMSERHATYSPVNRQEQNPATSISRAGAGAGAVTANQQAHVPIEYGRDDGQLDASPPPLLSAVTHVVVGSEASSQQQSLPPRIPPRTHLFGSTRSDTITELFGPHVPSTQPDEHTIHQNAGSVHSGSLRSSLSMSVFDIRPPAVATDAQPAVPRSPVTVALANDSESTGDGNTEGMPATSLRSSGMSQYIDLSGMQNHQVQPPSTAATEYAAGAVTHAATLAVSAPLSPAVPSPFPTFSRVASDPGSPTTTNVAGHTEGSAVNHVEDCPSQAAKWTPRLGHRIPDPIVPSSARPQIASPPEINQCATTRITTDCKKDKPGKLVAPPLRKRTITSPTGYPREILDVLEAHFEKCSHLCKERAELIGQEAGGLEKFRVDNWFHNRRKNYKKRGYELKCDPDECVDVKLKPAKPPVKRKRSAASTRQSSLTNMDTSMSAATSADNGAGANSSNPTMAPSLSAFFQSIMANQTPLSRFHVGSVGSALAGQSSFGSAAGPVSQTSASHLPPRMPAPVNTATASTGHVSQQPLQRPIPCLNASPTQTHGQLHFTHHQAPPSLQHHPMVGFPLSPPVFPLYPTTSQVSSFPTFPAWPIPSSTGTPPMPRPPTSSSVSSAEQQMPPAPPAPFMSPASYYSMFNMAHLMHHQSPQGPNATVPIPMPFPMTHSPFILVQQRPHTVATGATTAPAGGTSVGQLPSSVPVSSLLSDMPASSADRSLSVQSGSAESEASDGACDIAQRQQGSTASSVAAYTARSIEGPRGERSGAASETNVPNANIAASQATKRKAEDEAMDDATSPNEAKRPKHDLIKKEG
ncbi:hypothetical protein BCR44DRAFT_48913 [Catenaria anguillulae PL171]|uniref:Homeobox domain-containing protein n=1 Tax=Catenaria anguillulae PL171 TaxID=765915 RepID=A0A1Y2I3P6_9FUNG|nr:hypothetical protein BCR44DRAFT_48913 [Catenaria anguillulae PL171]